MPEPTYDMPPSLEIMRLHLEREEAIYAQLLDLGRRQQAALVARDTEAVLHLVSAQSALASEATDLHRQGREALKELSVAWELPAGTTVSELLERLPPESCAVLTEVRDRIVRCADEIAGTQQTNRLLLESAMDAVRFSMQVIADASREPEAGYAASEAPHRSASLILDQTA